MVDQGPSTAVLHLPSVQNRPRSIASSARPQLLLYRGMQAILHLRPRLVELAKRTGQSGEADNLAYFLSRPAAWKKTPWLVCEESGGEWTGAVLLVEYRGALRGSNVFTSEDATGRRTVLAPLGERDRLAASAARFLLERGAHIVHLCWSQTHTDERSPPPFAGLPGSPAWTRRTERGVSGVMGTAPSGRWALTEREMRVYLPLLATFDETLARIGQRTRSNLRYYRRRSEAELGAHFIAAARPTRDEFLAFNRLSQYAVDDALAGWRFDSLQTLSSPFLSGVRDQDGQWLSLVGGRRQNGFAEIDWQMNRADQPSYSLGLVMRAYLIQHEIALGSTRLYIEGGTPQPIGLSFASECVAELTIVRNSMVGKLLDRFGHRVAPARNYLGQILGDPSRVWHRCHG